ncbi:MAG: hypothetical protein ACC707_19730 [Thiohalomonadales bacterium]
MNTRKFIKFLFVALLTLFITGCGGGGGGGSNSGPDADILPLKLPFNYTIGDRYLEVPTSGGTVYFNIAPFATHVPPFTGHMYGDAKINLLGLFVQDIKDLSELPGSGGNDDGLCDPGESCGYWGELDGAGIRAKTPAYIAPADAMVTRVVVSGSIETGLEWLVGLKYNNRFQSQLGEIATISAGLRDKIFAATGIDTDAYSGPPGELFSNGTIPVSKGEVLAMPNVLANEIPDYPGYFRGPVGGIPSSIMEFNQYDDLESSYWVCAYDLMSAADKTAIQRAMENDMNDPQSPRYASIMSSRWVWSAEGAICPVYAIGDLGDYSSIHSRTGGWSERPEDGAIFDEWLAIVRIEKSSLAYSANNYSSAAVNYVITRAPVPDGSTLDWLMPDGATVNRFFAAGEVLEETANSLLIKWRDIGWTGPAYQRVAFALDSRGLKVKWGEFAADALSTIQPVLLATEACNGNEITCYDHTAR